MATVNFKIKIGCKAAEAENPSQILFKAELKKEEIQRHHTQFTHLINKYRLPTVILSIPEEFKEYNMSKAIDKFQDIFTFQNLTKDGRYYYLLEAKNPQLTSILKKIEKIFEQITKLDNSLYVKINLHNVDQYPQSLKENKFGPLQIYLQNIEIVGKVDLQKRFFETIGLLLGKISPNFQNSPIMAIVDLFEEFYCQLQLDTLANLKQSTREAMFTPLAGYEEPDDDAEGILVKNSIKSREKVHIYLNFNKLGYLHLQFEVRLWGLVACTLAQKL